MQLNILILKIVFWYTLPDLPSINKPENHRAFPDCLLHKDFIDFCKLSRLRFWNSSMREWERNYWFFKRSSFIIIEYPIPALPMHSKLHPIITGYLFSEDTNKFQKIHLTCARLNLVSDCLRIVMITKDIFSNKDYAFPERASYTLNIFWK